MAVEREGAHAREMELTNFSCAREKLPLACTREKIEMREGRDGE